MHFEFNISGLGLEVLHFKQASPWCQCYLKISLWLASNIPHHSTESLTSKPIKMIFQVEKEMLVEDTQLQRVKDEQVSAMEEVMLLSYNGHPGIRNK